MNNLLRFLRGHAPDVTALSARLDGQLDASASARLDEHVASCDACRVVLDGLRTTRNGLRALPEVDAPRSFRLRAADLERAPVAAAAHGTDVLRWAPALGAVAAAVFVVVLAADLRSSDGDPTRASAPSAMLQATHVEPTDSGGLAASKSGSAAGATPAAGIAGSEQRSAPTSVDRAPALSGAVPPEPGAAGVGSATPALPGSEQYNNTDAGPPSTASARAAGDIAATSARAEDKGGNNSTALRVIEIIAAATVVAAAVGVIVRRRRGDGV